MTPCPTDDTLGALAHRALDASETERVTSHLDECVVCRQTMVAAVRGGLGTPGVIGAGPPTIPEVDDDDQAPAAIGDRIGRYEVRALIGVGGMGHVYEAYDRELDRSIALKVLRPGLQGAAVVLAERLMRESRLMAKVVHAAVITVHDVGREGDSVFIAMELIRGETLASYVTRSHRTWREIVTLYERAAEGLTAAHRVGIVHRDFKPDNVLVETGTQRAVVTDFGIARATALDDVEHTTAVGGLGDINLTAVGVAIGTPAYMAPEQLAALGSIDQRADVFAFSVSLWESLFGQRPFAGKTVAEIRESMATRPRAPRGGVPRRIVRILERGLQIDPRDRWPDLALMMRELAAVLSRRRRMQIGLAAAGLVGVGIAGALALARPAATADPCQLGLAAFSDVYNTHRAIALAAALARDPLVSAEIRTKVDSLATAWRETHRVTCRADRQPAQHPTTTACLDARRLELDGFIEDVIADGPVNAVLHSRTVGDPGACLRPAPSLSTPSIPDDPALRRKVTAIRYRAYAAELARDAGDIETALAAAPSLVAEAKATWPHVHAETLYVLGMTQVSHGDSKQSRQTFRDAAAVAQAAHHDYIAAHSWIELTAGATFDDGDPARGLEYLTYAEAAMDRLGRPPKIETLFEYVKGTTLIEANRTKEAEVSLRRAVELAETTSPEMLPATIQGLGFLYERQGAYIEAVSAYRRALASNTKYTDGSPANEAIFRTRLAINLSLIGNSDDAETEARKAVEISDRILSPEHTDRAIAHQSLATVLHTIGKYEAALGVIQAARRDLAKTQGERSQRYAEALSLEGEILDSLERYVEAEKAFARACDIMAFEAGDDSTPVAQCWVSESIALSRLGRRAEALALVEKALPLIVTAFGKDHPFVANALVARGTVNAEIGQAPAAIADLERAIAILETSALDPGLLGSATWMLAKTLWPTNRERARPLLDDAIAKLAVAPATWRATHAEASAFRTAH